MRLKFISNAQEILEETGNFLNVTETINFSEVFGNNNPVKIEIGSGKGRFILNQALENPDINFIGIEIYASAICKITSYRETLPQNLRIITEDVQKLFEFIPEKSIEGIYLNFSDPWPKKRHEKRRLTYSEKLDGYKNVLVESGEIEFKTDNTDLFEYSIFSMNNYGMKFSFICIDMYRNEEFLKNNIATEYEEKFHKKGVAIKKLIAKF
jgi:tRNA (guanine-N7-)-methyltransferase